MQPRRSAPPAPHRVRGVAVGVAGLALGLFGGMFVAAVLAVLVRSRDGAVNATLLVLLTLLGVAGAGYALTRWAVPRLAGVAYQPVSPRQAHRLLLAASAITALLVGLTGLGDPLPRILLWIAGTFGAGVVGSWLATVFDRGAPRRGLTAAVRGQEGAASTEHVAVVVVIGAVVAALMALSIDGSVLQWARYAVCQLFAGTSCVEPQPHDPGPCLASSSSDNLHVEGSFIVSVDRDLGYTISQLSDGTVQVTYDNGGAVGAGTGVGLSVELFWDDASSKAGAEAQASIKATFTEGQSWEFTGPDALEDARDWADWHAVNAGAADLFLPGGRNGLLGQGWDVYTSTSNWVANQLDFIPGIDGMDVPDEPEDGAVFVAGGIEADAGAFAGVVGEDDSDGQVLGLGANVEAAVSGAVGTRFNADGTTTVFVEAEGLLTAEGSAGTGNSGVDGNVQLGDSSMIAITLDDDNRPVSATVTTKRLDEAGLDLSGQQDVSAAMGDAMFANGSTDGLADAPSVYEVTATLDLTEDVDADVLNSLLAGKMAQGVGPVRDALLEDFYAASDVTVAEYEVDQDKWGALVNGEAVVKAGGGLTLGSESTEVQNAWYYDPARGSYRTWDSCLAAAQ